MFHPQGPSFRELARQCLSSTEEGYDLLAPKFAYTPFRTPDEIMQPAIDFVLGEHGCRSALDICCGTGAAMMHLRRHCHERVVGIDFSQGMLDEAREAVATAEGCARIDFIKHDVLTMTLHEGFDAAVCFGAFGHVQPQDEVRFVRNIHHALTPGGRFFFVTAEHPPVRSKAWLLSKAFNAVMHVRNWILKPEFVMYYLTFLLPEVRTLLEDHGFVVRVHSGIFEAPYHQLKLVVAAKT